MNFQLFPNKNSLHPHMELEFGMLGIVEKLIKDVVHFTGYIFMA
jgi:hypothetical protein